MPKISASNIPSRRPPRRGHLSAALSLSTGPTSRRNAPIEVDGELTAGKWKLIKSDDGYRVGQLARAIDIRSIKLQGADGQTLLEDIVGLQEGDLVQAGCSTAEARFVFWVGRGFSQRPPLIFKLV